MEEAAERWHASKLAERFKEDNATLARLPRFHVASARSRIANSVA